MRTIVLKNKDIYRGNLILVNSQNPIHSEISEHSLVSVDGKNPSTLLEHNSARMLRRLIREIQAEKQIVSVSGWRSKEEQTKIYNDSLTDNGEEFTHKFVALPGCSEHQTGLAIDLAENKSNIDFIRPDFPYKGICQKFRKRAPYLGFIERYPRGSEDITHIAWEPWHFRFVGYPHSIIMKKEKMTLEEYHNFIKKHLYRCNPLVLFSCGHKYEISYQKANRGTTSIDVTDDCMISGNNMDGYIITKGSVS